jgi:alkylation response protein AidB-like acyl-CoA dehydrogenase
MTEPEKGNHGITAFVVDMNGEGVTRGPKDDKLGIRASHSCQIFFTDHRVGGTRCSARSARASRWR